MDPDGGFQFLVGDGAIYELTATTKIEALATLVELLVENGGLASSIAPVALEALYRREELGSTAIGGGIAIPHARIDEMERVVGVIGHAPQGIDFESPDGAPVTKLFLLLTSKGEVGRYLEALEKIARALRATN
ncbi:PTS sugar transporter subunit IIA [Blastopirellula sp. JC732]|uniref:PTS sugar transporter subunit IIA n=1 Tax=Blastopirellula sediminis TaxID=2894196 RepID=A0A9X1SHV7_9BACT|nr:PTS sugar transporter subunit IIA [Blastopirellula sediminis]MCC9605817.1 PTS sugar transporter subunit IIA [Blastopirellula sediminis]MCC9630883.1 PTS sugar transporter subunit IIA [Blastopirellula sediminis]